MTLEIIIPGLLCLLALFMGYGYIRLALAKDKENELLKKQIQNNLDSKKDELFNYKFAVDIMEKYANKPIDKRLGVDNTNDKVIGILTRCGFFVQSVNDNEEHVGKKEVIFRKNQFN